MNEKKEEYEDRTLAALTYSVSKNSEEIIIDVSLAQYDKQSTQALSSILTTIAKDSCIMETITIIKDCLIGAGQEEILLELLTAIGKQATEKAYKNIDDNNDERPCISPSDML
tara:strand:+ start:93 stop:431 length:339 start_codon:yes stop_codon:yes gene_type:complete